jgi:aminoglycoside 3'-phosphotransferase II
LRRKLPPALRRLVRGYRWQRVAIGESGADTFRLTCEGRPELVLKRSRNNPHLSLRDECERLRWLSARITAPQVVHFETHGNEEWLLMTALPGINAAEAPVSAKVAVAIVADALKALHALDVASCPFDETLDRKIARAAQNVADGLVEERHFDAKNIGRSAESLFEEMLASRPSAQDVVVTHGDACLPNMMIEQERFAGFVDCNRVGRADRYQDLALACRSIEYDFGEEWVAVFLARYGLTEVDADRIAFYRLLDEFS